MLVETVAGDLKRAMKDQDEILIRTLRMIRSEFRYREIELKHSLSAEDEIACIRSAIKRRSESSETYRSAGRIELAQREDEEADVLRRYLPEELDGDELSHLIRESAREVGAVDAKDFGRLMKTVMSKVAGRADGAVVSGLVKEYLK